LLLLAAFGGSAGAAESSMQRALHAEATKAMSAKKYEAACKAFCELLCLDADDARGLKGLKRAAYSLAQKLESKDKAAQWCRAVLFIDDANVPSRALLEKLTGATTAEAHDKQAKQFEQDNNILGTYVELMEAERVQHDPERLSHMKHFAFSARLDLIKLAGISDTELQGLKAAAVKP
jgi:hypothetical protein